MTGKERSGVVDLDTRGSKRNGQTRLTVVVMAFILAGCASDGDQEVSNQRKDTSPGEMVTTKITDPETGQSVSVLDSCQAYVEAPPELETLFDAVACTQITVQAAMVGAGSNTAVPEWRGCGVKEIPEVPRGMKRSMDGFCAKNPDKALKEALDIYWDESIKKGAFN